MARAPAIARFAARRAYAGLVTRLAALLVDGALLAAAVPLIGSGIPGLWAAVAGSTPGWVSACAHVVAVCTPIVYFALLWWAAGQTIGGLLFGASVRRTDGTRLGAIRASARAVIGLALAPLWLLGMVVIIWEPRRRAVHDLLLGTVVQRNSAGAKG